MCGIAGIISLKGISQHELISMSKALQHRGPNGYGYMLYSEPTGLDVRLNQEPLKHTILPIVGFAHRRLTIIDLSEASLQPMVNESGRYCLSYNGEIYNYPDLREELEALGYTFKTSGDVEVLLKAYEAWGPSCMEKLNGMWAFALLDLRRYCVILSRDRFGIKPLYYAVHDGAIYFASEIKGLLAVSALNRGPNESIVARFLLGKPVLDTQATFFEGIKELSAAHWAEIPLKAHSLTVHPQPYWSFPATTFQGTEQQAIAHFRELFLDAVKIHTRSDVPVGTCLSGGLDSSSIVCAAHRLRQDNQVPRYAHAAFGYCSADERFSEKQYMDIVVGVTGAKMHYIDVSPKDFSNHLLQIIQAQDEPFGSASIVAQWFVFQSAKAAKMTVMLDGQGADEIMAGYHSCFGIIASQMLARGDLLGYWTLRSCLSKEVGKFPEAYQLPSLLGLAMSARSPLLLMMRPLARLLRYSGRRLSSSLASSSSPMTQLVIEKAQGPKPVPFQTLNQALQSQVQFTSLPALLRYEDRNSMDHSIEARVPFLDYRLVEFLFTLPNRFKIRGVTTKYILREAMKGLLPEPIRTRKDKIGFKAAPNLTFKFAQEGMQSILGNKNELEERWFQPEGIKALLQRHTASHGAEFLLWRILNVKLWSRIHWGNDTV